MGFSAKETKEKLNKLQDPPHILLGGRWELGCHTSSHLMNKPFLWPSLSFVTGILQGRQTAQLLFPEDSEVLSLRHLNRPEHRSAGLLVSPHYCGTASIFTHQTSVLYEWTHCILLQICILCCVSTLDDRHFSLAGIFLLQTAAGLLFMHVPLSSQVSGSLHPLGLCTCSSQNILPPFFNYLAPLSGPDSGSSPWRGHACI